MNYRKAVGGFLFACALSLSCDASAAQVVISDCDGGIRAVGASSENSNTSVVIKLASRELPAAGIPVTLSNGIDTKSATSNEEGRLSFEKIEAGKWTACVEKQDVVMSDISVIKANPESSVGPLALLSAGLAGVGGIAVGGLTGSSGSDDGSAGTLSELAGSGNGSSLLEDGNKAPDVLAARRPRAQADCKTNESPDTLSPFL